MRLAARELVATACGRACTWAHAGAKPEPQLLAMGLQTKEGLAYLPVTMDGSRVALCALYRAQLCANQMLRMSLHAPPS